MRDKACKSSKNRGEGVDKFGEKRTTKIRGFFLGTAFGRSRGCGQSSGPCGQRPGDAPSVQGCASVQDKQVSVHRLRASVQELRPASQGCGQLQDNAASVTGLRPAFTGCGQRSQACGKLFTSLAGQRPGQAASASAVHGDAPRDSGACLGIDVRDLGHQYGGPRHATGPSSRPSLRPVRPRAQRAFVAVPGVDINRADFSYSARAIPLESFRRFGGRARSGHQPCLFFILRPDHPPRELQEVWWPCPEWTSTVPIFHSQLGQVTACGQRSQASGQRSQDSGQRSQAAASVQDKRPAFTSLRPAFTACGQRSQACGHSSVHRQRASVQPAAAAFKGLRPAVQDKGAPAFTGCGQRSGQRVPAVHSCGQRSQCGQRSGNQSASVHRLAGHRPDKRPAFTGCGQRSRTGGPAFHSLGQLFTGLRPSVRTSGQRSQGCGQRSQPGPAPSTPRQPATACPDAARHAGMLPWASGSVRGRSRGHAPGRSLGPGGMPRPSTGAVLGAFLGTRGHALGMRRGRFGAMCGTRGHAPGPF
ncbi:hypothetical protein Cgig2_034069 [Carnegiea gigantea]|uniref:Uncharacterized protein n=1 Tax=Carnegiea gigantea TaxID=171969 RepID=A0A9Q1JIB5_9CARY|nr:hypothetical protein Cgig2_034069 [Carnegiea gigantea]